MRTKQKIGAIVLSFTLLLGSISPDAVEAAAKKVSLSSKKITITKGKSKTIKVKNAKKKVKWKISSGKKYITLKKKGKTSATVKGKKKGTAKVQAVIGKKKLFCTVVVKDKANITSGSGTTKPSGPSAGTRPSVTSAPSDAPQSPATTQPPQVTSNPTNAPDGANEQDVAALKKLIVEQRRRGARVSEDMSSGEYTWENGRLTKIIWFQIGLSGELDVSGLTELSYLDCSYNEFLDNLNVTKNEKLTFLKCECGQLSSLDVTKNQNLTTLYCSENPISNLDLTKNKNLEHLACAGNPLNSLDVTKNINLIDLYCAVTQLSSLDVTKNVNLTYLNCSDNQLSSLDVTKNVKLIELDCTSNQLSSVNLTQNENLTYLNCSDNQLSSLDVTKNVNLTDLSCASNQLSGVDLTQNENLTYLDCSDNQLSSLDVTKNVKLIELDCTSNQLSSLDVTKNKKLKHLRCDSTVIVIDCEQTPSISTPTPSTGTQTFQPAPPSPTIKSTPWPTPPSISISTPSATPDGNKVTPTPGIQKDNKFKAGNKEITVDDKDDSVYPVTISDLNEVTWTSESKRPDVDPITDGKSFNRDSSVSFTSLKDYNSGVCFYLNPCTDISQLEEYGEDGRLAYRNGDKDMSAYDYIRMKVTCENELCLRTYTGSEQFENAGFPGASTSETYESGWFHTTDESIWAEELTFTAGNTVKPEYATRTIFIPLSVLVDKGCDLSTLTAIGISPQGEGAECTIHYIDFVKVKYDTKVTGIELTAKKTEIEPGRATSVVATVTPKDATRRMVKWSSSDEEVATVNYEGIVVAKKEGKVTITAKATDGSKVSGSVEITVKAPDIVATPTPAGTATPKPGFAKLNVDLSTAVDDQGNSIPYNSAKGLTVQDLRLFRVDLPETLEEGSVMDVTVKGQLNGEKGFRACFIKDNSDVTVSNFANSDIDEVPLGESFEWTFTLKVNEGSEATQLQFKGITYADNIDDLTVSSIVFEYKPTPAGTATPKPGFTKLNVDLSTAVDDQGNSIPYNSAKGLTVQDLRLFRVDLPETLEEGSVMDVTVKGQLNGEKGFRACFIKENSDVTVSNFANSDIDEIPLGEPFEWTFTLKVNESSEATQLQFKGITYADNIDDLTVSSIVFEYKTPVPTPTPDV